MDGYLYSAVRSMHGAYLDFLTAVVIPPGNKILPKTFQLQTYIRRTIVDRTRKSQTEFIAAADVLRIEYIFMCGWISSEINIYGRQWNGLEGY